MLDVECVGTNYLCISTYYRTTTTYDTYLKYTKVLYYLRTLCTLRQQWSNSSKPIADVARIKYENDYIGRNSLEKEEMKSTEQV